MEGHAYHRGMDTLQPVLPHMEPMNRPIGRSGNLQDSPGASYGGNRGIHDVVPIANLNRIALPHPEQRKLQNWRSGHIGSLTIWLFLFARRTIPDAKWRKAEPPVLVDRRAMLFAPFGCSRTAPRALRGVLRIHRWDGNDGWVPSGWRWNGPELKRTLVRRSSAREESHAQRQRLRRRRGNKRRYTGSPSDDAVLYLEFDADDGNTTGFGLRGPAACDRWSRSASTDPSDPER